MSLHETVAVSFVVVLVAFVGIQLVFYVRHLLWLRRYKRELQVEFDEFIKKTQGGIDKLKNEKEV